jgi:adenylosuccinate synthase
MSIFNSELQQKYWANKQAAFERVKDLSRIKELDWEITPIDYICISPEEALTKSIENAQIIAALGAYFGDESKGKVNSILAKLTRDICQRERKSIGSFRANSGGNTGRTVFFDGNKFVFHLVPSAIVYGVDSFIGPECVVDLFSLFDEEIKPYSDKIDFSRLYLGNFALTLPYHRIMDVLGSVNNSSTGVGITQTHMSMKNKSCPKLDDLFNSATNLEKVLEKDMLIYRGFLKEKGWSPSQVVEMLEQIQIKNRRIVPDHVLGFARSSNQITYLSNIYRDLANSPDMPARTDVVQAAHNILGSGGKIVLETTQSYNLSNKVDHGYRYSTSADTSLSGCLASLDLLLDKYKLFCINVNKTPGTSRVGIGNIPGAFTYQDRFSSEGISSMTQLKNACSDFEKINDLFFSSIQENGLILPSFYEDETGKYELGEALAIASTRLFKEQGSTTGKPRVVGMYDAVYGNLVASRQGNLEFISAMDRGEQCNRVGIVVAHVVSLLPQKDLPCDAQGSYLESNGVKYRTGMVVPVGSNLPSSSSGVLNYCLPIVRAVEGWKETCLKELKPGDYLPRTLANFITLENHLTGFQTLGIGTGCQEDDYLFLRRNN